MTKRDALKIFMEKGRSMVEMLGVLAIIGILSAGALAGYQKAMAKQKANKTINQMAHIVNNIRTAVTHQKEYGEIRTQLAIDLNVFPAEMITTENNQKVVRNVYKGKVEVVGHPDTETFTVDMGELPKDVAVAISTMDWGANNGGLQEVYVSGADEADQEKTPPANPAN